MYIYGISVPTALFVNRFLIYFLLFFIAAAIYSQFKDRFLDYFLALFISSSISEVLKYVFNTPRPKPLLPNATFEGGSFPSTHATLAFTAFFFYLFACRHLSHIKKRRGKRYITQKSAGQGSVKYLLDIIFAILAIGVGAFRVIARAHFAVDIFGGLFIGMLIALLFAYYDISIKRWR